MVWEEKIFKGFLFWLPLQPEFFIEHNYLKELKEDHLEPFLGNFVKIQSIVSEKFFEGRIYGRTHGRTDARTNGQTYSWTHDGHNAMTTACWPSASGAKNHRVTWPSWRRKLCPSEILIFQNQIKNWKKVIYIKKLKINGLYHFHTVHELK